MNPCSLRSKLRKGERCIGPFCKLTDPACYEALGLAGFDFAIIDCEHGPISIERAQDLVRACVLRGVAPLIRVPELSESWILRALDIGAQGVHVPNVRSADDAQRVVEACYYRPRGMRGVCRYVRSSDYAATPPPTCFERANDAVLPVIHVEGIEAVRAIDAIAAVEGLGVIFIGPYDLSQACGRPGEVDHPEVAALMEQAVAAAARHGVPVGTFVESAETAAKWYRLGVTYLAYSVDIGLFLQGCKQVVQSTDQHIRKADHAH